MTNKAVFSAEHAASLVQYARDTATFKLHARFCVYRDCDCSGEPNKHAVWLCNNASGGNWVHWYRDTLMAYAFCNESRKEYPSLPTEVCDGYEQAEDDLNTLLNNFDASIRAFEGWYAR